MKIQFIDDNALVLCERGGDEWTKSVPRKGDYVEISLKFEAPRTLWRVEWVKWCDTDSGPVARIFITPIA